MLKVGEEKTIDLQNESTERFPYLLWQELFNIYHELECPYGNMSNIILDYDNCKEAFQKYYTCGPQKFTFELSKKDYYTSWKYASNKSDAKLIADATCEDVLMYIEIKNGSKGAEIIISRLK